VRIQAVGKLGRDEHAADGIPYRFALDGLGRLLGGPRLRRPSTLPGKAETDAVPTKEPANGSVHQLAEHNQYEKLEKIIQNS